MRENQIIVGNLLEIPLIRLNWIGSNPKNRSFYKNIFNYLTTFIAILAFMTQFLVCITKNYESIGTFVMDILTTAAMYQVTYRTTKCVQNVEKFSKMIDFINTEFWSTDFLDEKENEAIQKMYRFLIILEKGYFILTSIAGSGYFVSKFIEKDTPINIWPEHLDTLAQSSTLIYIITWIIQSIFLGTGIFTLTQHDSLLYIFVCVTLIEIDKLKFKFIAIGTGKLKEENRDVLRDCIEHHCRLLKFLFEIEELYSPILLHVLGTNMCGTAVAAFGVLLDVEFSKKIAFAVLAICLPMQLFIYCLLGQFVQDQTESVAEAVYYCKWENITDLQIRKALNVVLQRSQIRVNITMGGLLILSLETFKQVANMVFSVVTLFLQTRENT